MTRMRAAAPANTRIYAAGDIHGRADLLRALVRKIGAHGAQRPFAGRQVLIFLGDYIDRGPGSRAVIEFLLGGLPDNFEPVFLKGNHEALMLAFLQKPGVLRLSNWLKNGGGATLASYGLLDPGSRLPDPASSQRCQQLLMAAMPQPHLRFLQTLRLSITLGDYFFAHAGVRPGVALDAQREDDLLWIREEFLDYRGELGKVVVHGHTPSPAPELFPHRIGIDTHAFATGRLTAVVLQDTAREFLTT